MTTRQQQILDILNNRSATTYSLAVNTDAPEATVRRNIQTLRRRGHNIVYQHGFASLQPSELTIQA